MDILLVHISVIDINMYRVLRCYPCRGSQGVLRQVWRDRRGDGDEGPNDEEVEVRDAAAVEPGWTDFIAIQGIRLRHLRRCRRSGQSTCSEQSRPGREEGRREEGSLQERLL